MKTTNHLPAFAEQKMAILSFVVVLLFGVTDASRFRRNMQDRSTQLGKDTVDHEPMSAYKWDCFKSRPVFLQGNRTARPGAGMNPANITPFETVLKDGYLKVACVKDYMYHFGDKFGSNKFSYNQGQLSNSSIVRYSDLVAKNEQEPMSPAVCFSFCRTVPDMIFFGILNGRDCYCTPFYKAMAGDSGVCDSVCEGNPTLMCGSQTKSSIYSMHQCQRNTVGEVASALTSLQNATASLQALLTASNGTASNIMQKYGVALRDIFGQVGDQAAAGLCQDMMLAAGEVMQSIKSSAAITDQLPAIEVATQGLNLEQPISYQETAKAEELIKSMKKLTTKANNALEALASQQKFQTNFQPDGQVDTGAFNGSTNASHQYYSVMYFVDKGVRDVPTTCSGDPVGAPVVATADGCATLCDNSVHDCMGYQTMASAPSELGFCFLFSKLKTAQYYIGCNGTQKGSCTEGFSCMVKFSEVSSTLKPDASGKCKQCLRAATKADRCFKVPSGFSGCVPTTTQPS